MIYLRIYMSVMSVYSKKDRQCTLLVITNPSYIHVSNKTHKHEYNVT